MDLNELNTYLYVYVASRIRQPDLAIWSLNRLFQILYKHIPFKDIYRFSKKKKLSFEEGKQIFFLELFLKLKTIPGFKAKDIQDLFYLVHR